MAKDSDGSSHRRPGGVKEAGGVGLLTPPPNQRHRRDC